MGEIESARVDVGVLFDVAGRYDAVADTVDGLARSAPGPAGLRRVGRRVATTPRAVTPSAGPSTRSSTRLHVWARAAREIASALRASGDRYVDVDARGAVRLG